MMKIVTVTKRYWWPHGYAKPWLWRKVTVGYNYVFDELPLSMPIPPLPDEYLMWPGKERGLPKPPIIWCGDDQRASVGGERRED